MGIYLSTPSTDVALDVGTGEKLQFVVGEMQGWRKAMEDAHIAMTDISVEANGEPVPKFSLFAVFDGHGGKEVAKFAKLKYPELVLEQLAANNGDLHVALRESFHRVDELLEDAQYMTLLKELRSLPNPCDQAPKRSPLPGSGASLEDSDSDYELDLATDTFKRRAPKPASGRASEAEDADADKMISTSDAVKMIRDMLRKAAQRAAPGEEDDEDEEEGVAEEEALAKGSVLSEDAEEGDKAGSAKDDGEDLKALLEDALSSAAAPITSSSGKSAEDKSERNGDAKAGSKRPALSGLTVTMHDNNDEADSKTEGGRKEEQSRTNVLEVPESKNSEDNSTDISPKPMHPPTESDVCVGAPILKPKNSAVKRAPLNPDVSPVIASRKTADGMTCNLKPHRIMAGCTAVVALHVGSQLYVANAGDSRGVLCRKNGAAYALSYDHKPQQDVEMNRITAAGGFVNAVGRINGNLNLSRSLGDLKYKQVVQVPREEQIISAEPDITLTELQAGDRFFILACDGIWDCLTNQQACDFVSARLDQGLDCAAITKEVLHHCLAKDTSSSQGVGCDNMTFLLVLLNM